MKNFGPVVPIVTPCKLNGELDLAGFNTVCQEMLSAGVRGIFVAGSTGRGPWFSRKDRERICRAAADQVNGAVPLLAGCIALGVPEMLENACAMADNGAQIVIVTVPGYFHYSQAEVEKIYLKFADVSPIPVIVYDIPEFTNVQFANDMVVRLASHGNIIGFKDSSADFERFKGLVKSLEAFPDYYLMQGKENLIADSLRLGASGFIVSMIHLYPLAFTGLYNAVLRGDIELSESIQGKINKAIQLLRGSIERRPESSTLFHILNYALRQRGVCDNVLLDHEGESPLWLIENAKEVVEICMKAI